MKPITQSELHDRIKLLEYLLDEQRKTNQELVHYYNTALQHAKSAIIATDTHHLIKKWSQEATNLYGWSQEEVTGKHIGEVFNNIAFAQSATSNGGGILTGEAAHKTKTGEGIHVSFSILGLNNEEFVFIIQRKEFAKRRGLHEEKTQVLFKAIADSAPLAIYISKGVRQVAQYINPTFFKLFGYTHEEVSEVELWWPLAYPNEIYRKQISEEWNQKAEKAIQNKTDIEPMEVVVTCKDGSKKNILWGFVSTGDENWAFGLDLTEFRTAEQELIVQKEKAEESNKIKTVFLQNISHEVRTPMNAIMGFSQMLISENITTEKRQLYSEIIVKSSQQLLSIVDNILMASTIEKQQEKLTYATINVNAILYELQSIFAPKIEKQDLRLIIKCGLPDSNATFLTDLTKFKQVVSNLINNALKFTKFGFIEVGYVAKEDIWEFYVKDTGVGISREHHQKIFDRFHQVEDHMRENSGMGLGLAISKSFVELLNGKIWVESEEEKGAIFKFTLPNIEKNKSPQSNKPIEILVAEDDEFNYYFIQELLANHNIKAIHRKNGKEAVEYMENNTSVSLVLMDLNMPIVNGYEATRMIRETNKTIPIIAHSAFVFPHEIEKTKKNGFNDFITKPVNQDRLLEIIERYTTKNA